MSGLVEKVAKAIEEADEWCADQDVMIGTWDHHAKVAITATLEALSEEMRSPGDKGDFCKKYIQAFARANGITLKGKP